MAGRGERPPRRSIETSAQENARGLALTLDWWMMDRARAIVADLVRPSPLEPPVPTLIRLKADIAQATEPGTDLDPAAVNTLFIDAASVLVPAALDVQFTDMIAVVRNQLSRAKPKLNKVEYMTMHGELNAILPEDGPSNEPIPAGSPVERLKGLAVVMRIEKKVEKLGIKPNMKLYTSLIHKPVRKSSGFSTLSSSSSNSSIGRRLLSAFSSGRSSPDPNPSVSVYRLDQRLLDYDLNRVEFPSPGGPPKRPPSSLIDPNEIGVALDLGSDPHILGRDLSRISNRNALRYRL